MGCCCAGCYYSAADPERKSESEKEGREREGQRERARETASERERERERGKSRYVGCQSICMILCARITCILIQYYADPICFFGCMVCTESEYMYQNICNPRV